jgi:transcriptional regulator with XRE-family HTH domain
MLDAEITAAETIARTVRQRRTQLGLTQGEAAGLAGLSRRSWSQIELGRREGRDSTLVAVEEAIQLPAGSLLALRREPRDNELAVLKRQLVDMIHELTSVQLVKQVRADVLRRQLAAIQAELETYEAVDDEGTEDDPPL